MNVVMSAYVKPVMLSTHVVVY